MPLYASPMLAFSAGKLYSLSFFQANGHVPPYNSVCLLIFCFSQFYVTVVQLSLHASICSTLEEKQPEASQWSHSPLPHSVQTKVEQQTCYREHTDHICSCSSVPHMEFQSNITSYSITVILQVLMLHTQGHTRTMMIILILLLLLLLIIMWKILLSDILSLYQLMKLSW